jgi:hypothetical protein
MVVSLSKWLALFSPERELFVTALEREREREHLPIFSKRSDINLAYVLSLSGHIASEFSLFR